MATIKEIYKGESVTLLFTFPQAYNMARIEDHAIYIGDSEFTGTVVAQTIILKIKSVETEQMFGVQKVVLWLDDSTLGVRKPYCGDLVISKTKAYPNNISESNINDIIIPIVISETAITVDDILYNYVKGTTGNGIASIELISAIGLVKTYRITYTDSTTFEYSVSDGEKGDKGDKGDKGGDGSDANVTSVNVIAALGFTPENAANKQNSLAVDGTGTKLPTVDAVNAGLVAKTAIKQVTGTSETDVMSQKAVTDKIDQVEINYKKRSVFLFDSSISRMISYDNTSKILTIPSNLLAYIEGKSYKYTVAQSLTIINYALCAIMYNYENNTFYEQAGILGYSTLGRFPAFQIRNGSIEGIHTMWHMNNGRIISFYYDKPFDYSVLNKMFNLREATSATLSARLQSLQAIKDIKITCEDYKYKYSIQGLSATGNYLTIQVCNNLTGALLGPIVYFTDADVLSVFDTTYIRFRKSESYEAKIVTFDVVLDIANLGADTYTGLVTKIYVHTSNYIIPEYFEPKQYLNLGASTSGGFWHKRAVESLNGLVWKSKNVGGCVWRSLNGAVLDYTGVNNANNCMMNQVARLFKDFTDNGYYPDSITLMAGLGDAQPTSSIGGTIGTFADALDVDLTGLTPENWLSTAPESYRMNTAKSMSAVLKFISTQFPFSQLILVTVGPTMNSTEGGYYMPRVLEVNEIIRQVGARFGIPVIDMIAESGINDLTGNGTTFMSADNVHPNAAGELVMQKYMALKLKGILHYRK